METYTTTANGWSVFELAQRHRNAQFMEREILRQLTGWFTVIPEWETKHRMGYHAFSHAEHAQWLYERLDNLRGGNPEASLAPDFMAAVKRNIDAPTEKAFLAGLYLGILPRLLAEYKKTAEGADAAANAFDLRLIRRMIPELEEQIHWAKVLLEDDIDEEARSWMEEISTFAPDVREVVQRFRLPDSVLFDDRIGELGIMPHEEKIKLPYEQRITEQFRVFFNEIYAASILSTVVYESISMQANWPMTYWFSRHFWDEVRHSEFGARRLLELGSAPDRCDQTLFRNARIMPFIHRVCYLTLVLEKHYMPRKKPRFEEYGDAGDMRSQLFADHDWSDEMNHVRNGKDWLEALLESDARGVDDVKNETMAMLEELTGAPVASVSPF